MPVDNDLYDRIASSWWDETHPIAYLRFGLGPARFGYFKNVLSRLLGDDLRGTSVLDIGCGGGFLAEEFARLGCGITGIDPSVATLTGAKEHAVQAGLEIDYRESVGEALPFAAGAFRIVCCCDVLEHVRDLDQVIAEAARVLAPGGVFLYETINRTFMSKILGIKAMQEWKFTRLYETNLHDWEMFIKPEELRAALARNGLEPAEFVGLTPAANPVVLLAQIIRAKRGAISYAELGRRSAIRTSTDLSGSYIGYAVKR